MSQINIKGRIFSFLFVIMLFGCTWKLLFDYIDCIRLTALRIWVGKLLKDFKIIYSGNGNIVKEQSPVANARIKEGEEIRLLLAD